ncbi:MAG: 1-deoxy-D-xylulose-5-phosphate synthase [Micrococcales bacterium]|nr:1-deoxy-D-xylulose-5-phosphate synthase [Microbacteriaceae bacterium]NBR22519.1 1-deoxy-D-xylulose-5-phosphate synthase [Micrococcales bacterium]NBX94769.1 1-deoxy-D-xylulose-5-phosphate synthase [Actinomycetota bacterium]NBR77340.1 1-deoxy-D-xylulose-5-phosphate synthase [Microbacteriaceae bacterium]NBS60648.1 1-deoxy-D-xylulose-5-phosphate synthase [Microbacteriaceae bacterium]
MSILNGITKPSDLKNLTDSEMSSLAQEIREYLVKTITSTGGHLGPNLGVVELTLAIHRVFDSPNDRIIFDTGHQSYVHKLVTGRTDLSNIRTKGGIAGYPQRSESEHDVVESSHASSSLSWADGISRAYKLTGQGDRAVVAVIGDGALTGGMAWEALNNITDDNDRKLIIVVNDNGRSYAPTIGGLARYLNEVRTEPMYRKMYRSSRKFFSRFGVPGRLLFSTVRGAGKGLLGTFAPKSMFPNLDIKYIGPIDGHDVEAMEQALRQAEKFGAPVIVHAITQKGRGFTLAEEDTEDQFHAVGQIDPLTGKSLETKSGPSWTSVFSDEIVSLADKNESIVGITGAMLIPVGLKKFADKYPSRVFDVGIAEQHAVTSSAGLAFGGLHPVVAIYATFMNRAFDQVLMDVALHNAGVTFVLDRAGVTGPDGASHHGMWDLALLQIVPGIEIAAPRDATTLREELGEAIAINDRPTVLRFPKGSAPDEISSLRRLKDGVDVLSEAPSKDVLIVSVGAMAPVALRVAELLAAQGIGATVIDPRWVVPVRESVLDLAAKHRLVVTLEDGVRVGGIGTRIRQDLRAAQIDTALNELGLPDEFLEHASRAEIMDRVGLTAQSIAQEIVAQVVGARVPHAKPIEEITPKKSQQQL